ncbi:MAG: hypothetical protein PWR03_486 [Tenuifilum sp.]|jgi:phage shock protein PspC (stress-responsive transcriptional regulator)|uniref:PspC domain-containing protein n=1 Tax=Tenuifilum sp. TaxID=2760880 RepID=UPI0024AB51EB|nr:PspC domain-containing protein [Tenuifilum sp.]MDI3526303.1 hypothetical protein [Tenuifilum sp.]
MDKIVNVSIGGISFTLEAEAYSILTKYLNEVESRLSNKSFAKEVLADIEYRIAELLSERVKPKKVVPPETINSIVEQIGYPDEDVNSQKQTKQDYTHRKRIYRDSDEGIIAGVCSGLGAYFRVDPLVFRAIFIGLLFLHGFGLLFYLILWLSIPKAKTPLQKMEMMGDKQSIDNLLNEIKEDINSIGTKIKKSEKDGILGKLINLLGQILIYILKAIGIIVKVIAIIIGSVLIAGMLLLFISLVFAIFFASYGLSHFTFLGGIGISLNEIISSVIDISSGYWITIPLFLVFAIPIVALIYAGFRIIFRVKAKDKNLAIIALVLWASAIFALSITTFLQVKSFSASGQHVSKVLIKTDPRAPHTLYCKSFNYISDSTIQQLSTSILNLKLIDYKGEQLLSGEPKLIIEKSEENKPAVTIIKNSRGTNRFIAKRNAKMVEYSITQKDSVITFDPIFVIPNDIKWKNQSVTIELHLPVGQKIYIDETLAYILDENQPNCIYWPDELVGKTWVMTQKGLRPAK